MKNIRTVKNVFILVLLVLAILFAATSCDEVVNTKIPSWAIGKWSINEPGGVIIQLAAVEITSKEFIPREEISKIPFLSTILEKKEVTVVTSNTVLFDYITVEKGLSDQINVGIAGQGDITLYRMK